MYLVEFVPKEGEPGFNPQPVVDVLQYGRVEFKANPTYGGRRIVEVPSHVVRDRILARNLNGHVLFVEPVDLLASREHARVRRVVLEVLAEHGLLAGGESTRRRGAGRQEPPQ